MEDTVLSVARRVEVETKKTFLSKASKYS